MFLCLFLYFLRYIYFSFYIFLKLQKDSFELWEHQWKSFLVHSTIDTALEEQLRPKYKANLLQFITQFNTTLVFYFRILNFVYIYFFFFCLTLGNQLHKFKIQLTWHSIRLATHMLIRAKLLIYIYVICSDFFIYYCLSYRVLGRRGLDRRGPPRY